MIDIPDSGAVEYIDDYGTKYTTSWRTTELAGTRLLDFTTTILTPYIWGEPITGRITNRQIIRDGMCDVTRQVIAERDDGYEVVSEGGITQLCDVPLVFRAESAVSPFANDLNNELTSSTDIAVTSGPHFSDPDTDGDSCVFGDIGGATEDVFEAIDVWGS